MDHTLESSPGQRLCLNLSLAVFVWSSICEILCVSATVVAGTCSWESLLCFSGSCTIRMQECCVSCAATNGTHEANCGTHTARQSAATAKELCCLLHASSDYCVRKGLICFIDSLQQSFKVFVHITSFTLQLVKQMNCYNVCHVSHTHGLGFGGGGGSCKHHNWRVPSVLYPLWWRCSVLGAWQFPQGAVSACSSLIHIIIIYILLCHTGVYYWVSPLEAYACVLCPMAGM